MLRLSRIGFVSATLIFSLISPLQIQAIDKLPSTSLAKNQKISVQNSDVDQVQSIETPPLADQRLQKTLIAQNRPLSALLVSERSRTRSLVGLFKARFSANRQGGINNSLQAAVDSPSIEQIKQVAKQQNATLVEYSIISDESTVNGKRQTKESELYIWVVKPTGEIAFRSVDLKPLWQKENTSLTDLVTGSREQIGVRSLGVKGGLLNISPVEKEGDRVSPNYQKLHQLLIAPIADILPKNQSDKVIFIQQGVLFQVPFPALQDEKGKYLIEKHAISTAPSIQILDLLHQQRQSITNANDVLVVGNPDGAMKPPKIGEAPRKLLSLPGAEAEAKAVANIYNTQALTGKSATKAAVIERMPSAKIIHLAMCMFVDDVGGSQMPGVIPLTPSGNDNGWLTAEEVSKLNLNAELVVLSGGDTANGRITGDGVIGLPRAFMAAGARSAIATLWMVSDTTPVLLMSEFSKNLQQNPDKSMALQKAMLTTMKQYPNPRDWAAFTLIGEAE